MTAVRVPPPRSLTVLYGATPSNPNFLAEHHPLRADVHEPFFADKIEAEGEANELHKHPDLPSAASVCLLGLLDILAGGHVTWRHAPHFAAHSPANPACREPTLVSYLARSPGGHL